MLLHGLNISQVEPWPKFLWEMTMTISSIKKLFVCWKDNVLKILFREPMIDGGHLVIGADKLQDPQKIKSSKSVLNSEPD